MMTYKDAIKYLNSLRDNPDFDSDLVYAGYCDFVNLEALDKAIGALEQQVPRKPHTETDDSTTTYECPVCGLEFFRISTMHIKREPFRPYRPSYCYRCGQRLKWYNE